jgi:hypothetical protein
MRKLLMMVLKDEFAKKPSFVTSHPNEPPPKLPHLFASENPELPSLLKLPLMKYLLS